MAIGRITGQMLFSNLERQGVDLAIDGNLLYADVVNRRVGVNTTTPQYAFDSTGNVKLANLIIQHNRISSNTGRVDLGNISNITISGGSTNFVLFTDGAGNLGFGNIDVLANGAITGNGIVGNVNTANVAFFTNVSATTTSGTFYPSLFVSTTGNSRSFVATALNYNPGTMILTVPTITATRANLTTANVTALTASGGFFTPNIRVSGGFINGLANISTALSYSVQQNATNANVSGVLYAANFNSPNVNFTGTTSGTVSTANVALYSNVLSTGNSGVHFVSFYNTNVDGNAQTYVSANLNYEPDLGNLTTHSFSANNNVSANVVVVDYIQPRNNVALKLDTVTAVKLPTGNTAQRPATATIGYFRYNSQLGKLEYYDGDEWIPVELNSPTVGSQLINGDGVTTAFNLDSPNETAQGLLVSINGTTQIPDVAYTVAANVITFVEPPLSTDSIDIRFLSTGTTIGGNVGGNLSLVNGALEIWGNTGVSNLDNSETVASWYLTLKTFSVAGQETGSTGITFKPDGTKMYIVGTGGDDITEYNLSVAWDIATATFNQSSPTVGDTAPGDIYFKTDGTKLYIVGTTGQAVREFTLGTAWDVSTISFVQAFSVAAQETAPQGLEFSPDLSRMYVCGTTTDTVYQYNLSIAGDVSTAVLAGSYSVTVYDTAPQSISFDSTGTRLILSGSTFDQLYEFRLSTPWDITTAGFVDYSTIITILSPTPNGLYWSPAQARAWVVDSTSDSVREISTVSGVRLATPSFSVSQNLNVVGDVSIVGNIMTRRSVNIASDLTVASGLVVGSTATFNGATVTVGASTAASTIGLATGATVSGSTKSVNIGTSGAAGSFSNIQIGPTVAVGNVFYQRGTQVFISNTFASSSSTTGALIVSGGVGVAGAINATGGITSGTGTNGVSIGTDGGAIEIIRQNGEAYIDFRNQDTEDYDVRIQSRGNSSPIFSVSLAAAPNALQVYNNANVNLSGLLTVNGNVLPAANVTYNLGSSTARWKDLWLSGNTIFLGGASLTANSTQITLTNELGGSFAVSGTAANQVTTIAGNLNISGNILPTGANVTQRIGSPTQWFEAFYGRSIQAVYADLAEKYVADAVYPPGTVVVFGGEKEITESTHSHDTRVAGVVSTNPAYIMNAQAEGTLVALTGRVPCWVQGPVQKGDVLVTGTHPGTAQRIGVNWQPGCVLGKSLSTIFGNQIELIEVVVGRF